MVEATIEDLAITHNFSRESDEVRRQCCIEHDFAKRSETSYRHGNGGQRKKEGCLGAEFRAAEKDGEGMALKIFTGAKPFQKARIKMVDITGLGMLPRWN